MDKKELFKEFAKNNPKLIDYVKENNISWQKLYEIYDIYGDDNKVWEKYLNPQNKNTIKNIIGNINTEELQSHIKTAKKALGFIEELTKKDITPSQINIPKIEPNPINKFFGD